MGELTLLAKIKEHEEEDRFQRMSHLPWLEETLARLQDDPESLRLFKSHASEFLEIDEKLGKTPEALAMLEGYLQSEVYDQAPGELIGAVHAAYSDREWQELSPTGTEGK